MSVQMIILHTETITYGGCAAQAIFFFLKARLIFQPHNSKGLLLGSFWFHIKQLLLCKNKVALSFNKCYFLNKKHINL